MEKSKFFYSWVLRLKIWCFAGLRGRGVWRELWCAIVKLWLMTPPRTQPRHVWRWCGRSWREKWVHIMESCICSHCFEFLHLKYCFLSHTHKHMHIHISVFVFWWLQICVWVCDLFFLYLVSVWMLLWFSVLSHLTCYLSRPPYSHPGFHVPLPPPPPFPGWPAV